jgi:hypothetical protein
MYDLMSELKNRPLTKSVGPFVGPFVGPSVGPFVQKKWSKTTRK